MAKPQHPRDTDTAKEGFGHPQRSYLIAPFAIFVKVLHQEPGRVARKLIGQIDGQFES